MADDVGIGERAEVAGVDAAKGGTWHWLPFKMWPQEQTRWCWVAVAAAVAKYYDSNTPWIQCKIASTQKKLDCCPQKPPKPLPPGCNTDGHLDLALTTVGHFNKYQKGALDINTIAEQIQANCPVGARIEWSTGGSHYIAIIGGQKPPVSAPYVAVTDPLPGHAGKQIVLLSALLDGTYSGTGKWTDTDFIKP